MANPRMSVTTGNQTTVVLETSLGLGAWLKLQEDEIREIGVFKVTHRRASAARRRGSPHYSQGSSFMESMIRSLVAMSLCQPFQDSPLAGPSLDMVLVPVQERARFA
jgi:hypothetical protein